MRFSEPLNIVLEPSIENDEVLIAPLILISLVENAFKYALATAEPKVSIGLRSSLTDLHIHILNSRNSNLELSASKNTRKKIGARNVVSQLELLYPQQHELMVQESENTYEVNLKLLL